MTHIFSSCNPVSIKLFFLIKQNQLLQLCCTTFYVMAGKEVNAEIQLWLRLYWILVYSAHSTQDNTTFDHITVLWILVIVTILSKC